MFYNTEDKKKILRNSKAKIQISQIGYSILIIIRPLNSNIG